MQRRYPRLFHGVNDVDLYTAKRNFQTRALQAGEHLFEAGDPADVVVCVVTGRLQVRHDDTVLGEVGPDDLLGEMALFESGRRTASAVALEPTQVMSLDREGYEALRDVAHPVSQALEHAALRHQVGRLRAVGDRIAALSHGTPASWPAPSERFFAALAQLFGRGAVLPAGKRDPLPALRRSGLFSEASDESLVAIAAAFQPVAHGAGYLLCREGERGDRMYVLDEGEVEVVVATEGDRVQQLATLGSGAAFGMVSLAEDRPRMSTCIARTEVVAHALDEEGWKLLLEDPGFGGSAFRRGIIELVSHQLGRANEQLAGVEASARASGSHEALRRAGVHLDTHGIELAETG